MNVLEAAKRLYQDILDYYESSDSEEVDIDQMESDFHHFMGLIKADESPECKEYVRIHVIQSIDVVKVSIEAKKITVRFILNRLICDMFIGMSKKECRATVKKLLKYPHVEKLVNDLVEDIELLCRLKAQVNLL
jgi:hypothetical protein